MCMRLETVTIPGHNPYCPTTPTVMAQAACPTCQKGCGVTVCRTKQGFVQVLAKLYRQLQSLSHASFRATKLLAETLRRNATHTQPLLQ
jgi:hypothetical protein